MLSASRDQPPKIKCQTLQEVIGLCHSCWIYTSLPPAWKYGQNCFIIFKIKFWKWENFWFLKFHFHGSIYPYSPLLIYKYNEWLSLWVLKSISTFFMNWIAWSPFTLYPLLFINGKVLPKWSPSSHFNLVIMLNNGLATIFNSLSIQNLCCALSRSFLHSLFDK